MRNIILTMTLAFFGLNAIAQTGIGTPNPNPSTELHIEATDKGILIPNVELSDLDDSTTITGGNVNSLLVYNTSNTGNLSPGYYYWLDTEWQRLMPQSDIYSNVKYDGSDFYYMDDSGNEVQIDLENLINETETNTFIRKVDAVIDADGTVTSPTVYYYFSEEAIKTWLAADASNTDPSNMLNTDPGVVAIEIAGDVADNFEYILNQKITYEGDQKTIEEVIEIISSQVDGNVVYKDVGGEMVFQYYDKTTDSYITINLDELVKELETNTFIRKVDAVIDADGTVTSPTVYYYFSEEAIKTWLAADASNTDPSNMLNTDPGVVAIEIAGDVADNFEYILNQKITYEGDQKTIEEVIEIISSQVDGNVVYKDVGGEMVFQYYDKTTDSYITINLDELVKELETNTFIRKVDAVIDADGTVTSPTVYYYFSEEAIKTWLAADASNTDPSNMLNTDPGVVAIEIAGDVADNFEYILNQKITYEGDQKTIEEVIEIISSQVDGNVVYKDVGGEMVFQYYDKTTDSYITINLGEFVRNNQLTYEVKGVDDVNVTDVVVDNHTTYTVEVKAAMPKFFYMPTILFDTSTIQNGLTIDLHAEYIDQFTGASIKKNPGAPAAIPHLPTASDLNYYVTDFDNSVLEIVGITDTGVLTYNVISNSGPYSYVTIVFVVK